MSAGQSLRRQVQLGWSPAPGSWLCSRLRPLFADSSSAVGLAARGTVTVKGVTRPVAPHNMTGPSAQPRTLPSAALVTQRVAGQNGLQRGLWEGS